MYEQGLTLGRYKRVVSLLAAPSKTIDEVGGLLSFLGQNEVEGARILPAAKNQKKDEHGDTIIETDSEAYILSKQMAAEDTPRDFLDSIDALLESACFDSSTRADVLSNLAARGIDGSGYGVPVGMPNLIALKDGEIVVPTSDEAHAAGEPVNTAGGYRPSPHGAAGSTAQSTGSGGGSGNYAPAGFGSRGLGSDGASGEGFGTGVGFGVAPALSRDQLQNPGSRSFMELVESSVQRSLLDERSNPHRSYSSLARILRNMGVDKILTHFPAERREELTSLPPEHLAAEYIQETALQLAGAKLKSAGGSSDKLLIEEDVVRVLARSLLATQMADRLAQKLSKFIQDFAVPPHIQEKIV